MAEHLQAQVDRLNRDTGAFRVQVLEHAEGWGWQKKDGSNDNVASDHGHWTREEAISRAFDSNPDVNRVVVLRPQPPVAEPQTDAGR